MGNLIIEQGDLFATDIPNIGHGVNVEGLMTSGIAVRFKNEFPLMHDEYLRLCESGEFVAGEVMTYKVPQKRITHEDKLAIGEEVFALEASSMALGQAYALVTIFDYPVAPTVKALHGLIFLDWKTRSQSVSVLIGSKGDYRVVIKGNPAKPGEVTGPFSRVWTGQDIGEDEASYYTTQVPYATYRFPSQNRIVIVGEAFDKVLVQVAFTRMGWDIERRVFNLASQHYGGANARMEYLESSLRATLAQIAELGGTELALPQIGCGVGGLRWEEVSELLEEGVKGYDIDLTVYVYQP